MEDVRLQGHLIERSSETIAIFQARREIKVAGTMGGFLLASERPCSV